MKGCRVIFVNYGDELLITATNGKNGEVSTSKNDLE